MRYLAAAALSLFALPAIAETPVTSLNGNWAGSGKDRDTPMHSLQPAQCAMQISATPVKLTSASQCDTASGLKKRMKMTVTFAGDDFTGSVEQWSQNGNAEPNIRTGRITGRRHGDKAELTARFPGLTPNAHVVLELTSPDKMAMTVTTLGSTLTDVTYQRRTGLSQR